MDACQFDSFARTISRSRRVVAGGLLGFALSPIMATARRKKRKSKKKKPACTTPNVACGQGLCCNSNQQCVSGQCQDPVPNPSPCVTQGCTGFTNPVIQGGACACRATSTGPSLCFAQQECGGLGPCGAHGECAPGFACMAQSCGGKPTCVRTCV